MASDTIICNNVSSLYGKCVKKYMGSVLLVSEVSPTEHHSGWYSFKHKLYACAECTLHCTHVQSIFSGG